MEQELELIYVADPMCSWCWGFAPVIRAVSAAIAGKAALRVLPGGLRTGVTMPLHESEVSSIMHHWRAVAERSGQPFDFERPLDTNFVYDSEAACRALSIMNRERPKSALDYLHSLHQAFYVGRRDLKDAEVLADYAQSFGCQRGAFIEQLDSGAARDWLADDLHLVSQLGVQGFPSVLLRSGQRVQRLTNGYQPMEAIRPHLERWVDPTSG